MTIGDSGAAVFRLTADRSVRFLKVTPRAIGIDGVDEVDRLRWLKGKLPVPDVLGYAEDATNAYLLLSALPGADATDKTLHEDKARLTHLLAEGLRTIHALPIADCPFDQRLEREIERAGRRVAAGLVDEADFDEERLGRSASAVFAELLASRPSEEDLVFIHGDYCLPNVMIDEWQISSFIDLGRAGVSDRYHDLAQAVRSVRRNLGAEWVQRFLSEYGIHEPDERKLTFYTLLDEFF